MFPTPLVSAVRLPVFECELKMSRGFFLNIFFPFKFRICSDSGSRNFRQPEYGSRKTWYDYRLNICQPLTISLFFVLLCFAVAFQNTPFFSSSFEPGLEMVLFPPGTLVLI